MKSSLAEWLDEREIDLTLRESVEEPFMPEEQPGPKEPVTEEEGLIMKKLTAVAPYDKEAPVRGQLILLSRKHFDGIFPLHAVVLYEEWMMDGDKRTCIIVPFSWYSSPAIRHEFRLGGEDLGMWCRVACPWAAITVDWDLLDTWKLGEIASEDVDDIQRLFRCCLMGEDVPEELIPRTCPAPIVHSKDPRKDYQEEMCKIVHTVQGTAMTDLIGDPESLMS